MTGGLASDPELEEHGVDAVEGRREVGRRGQGGWMAEPVEDPAAERADELETLPIGVDEHELVDGQHVLEAPQPVHQLRCVRRPAADDCDLHGVVLIPSLRSG